jgi:hypothetical protein
MLFSFWLKIGGVSAARRCAESLAGGDNARGDSRGIRIPRNICARWDTGCRVHYADRLVDR